MNDERTMNDEREPVAITADEPHHLSYSQIRYPQQGCRIFLFRYQTMLVRSYFIVTLVSGEWRFANRWTLMHCLVLLDF